MWIFEVLGSWLAICAHDVFNRNANTLILVAVAVAVVVVVVVVAAAGVVVAGASPPYQPPPPTYSSNTHPFYSVIYSTFVMSEHLMRLKTHAWVFEKSRRRFWTGFGGGGGGWPA